MRCWYTTQLHMVKDVEINLEEFYPFNHISLWFSKCAFVLFECEQNFIQDHAEIMQKLSRRITQLNLNMVPHVMIFVPMFYSHFYPCLITNHRIVLVEFIVFDALFWNLVHDSSLV